MPDRARGELIRLSVHHSIHPSIRASIRPSGLFGALEGTRRASLALEGLFLGGSWRCGGEGLRAEGRKGSGDSAVQWGQQTRISPIVRTDLPFMFDNFLRKNYPQFSPFVYINNL